MSVYSSWMHTCRVGIWRLGDQTGRREAAFRARSALPVVIFQWHVRATLARHVSQRSLCRLWSYAYLCGEEVLARVCQARCYLLFRSPNSDVIRRLHCEWVTILPSLLCPKESDTTSKEQQRQRCRRAEHLEDCYLDSDSAIMVSSDCGYKTCIKYCWDTLILHILWKTLAHQWLWFQDHVDTVGIRWLYSYYVW